MKYLSTNGDIFCSRKRAVSKGGVDLQMLCPTEDAIHQHSYCVYLQVQAWLSNNLPLTEWGWKKVMDIFEPIRTTKPIAPDTLLKKLFCGCKRGCGVGCGCRKLGKYSKCERIEKNIEQKLIREKGVFL